MFKQLSMRRVVYFEISYMQVLFNECEIFLHRKSSILLYFTILNVFCCLAKALLHIIFFIQSVLIKLQYPPPSLSMSEW